MGSQSDMSAMNRANSIADEGVWEVMQRIRRGEKLIEVRAYVGEYYGCVAFGFESSEVEIELITDPDDERLWEDE